MTLVGKVLWLLPPLFVVNGLKISFQPSAGGLRVSPIPAEVDYSGLGVDTHSPFWIRPESIGLMLQNVDIEVKISANIASTKLKMKYENNFAETVHPYMHLPAGPS